MNINSKLTLVACVMGATLLLASCGTSKNATGTTTSSTFSTPAYINNKVMANQQTSPALCAKMSFTIEADGKQMNVGGNLKMKRDNVVQLSLVALGIMEAGRLEFTPDGVLLIDRINRQYVRATYNDLKFLRDAGIDFYCLQALFWDELFLPGTNGKIDASRFKSTPSGQSLVLQPEGTKKLVYRFITELATGLVRQTNISSEDVSERVELNWRYNNFTTFQNKKFPDNITISVDGTDRTLKVNIGLSRFSTDNSWETRTAVSSKYKQVSAESIIKKIMAL